ncbi:MAG: hypothetical protein HYS87_03225 [Candidatus Colwellbacteria bacterium]|nr:hypothetical protein [Candidatus Colwellbacteria bacterium]
MKTALISVYHKDGIVEFARRLLKIGDWEILASGGTAKHLENAGIPVEDVATLVGKPILGHRVVTLSREIHAALLARDTPEDQAELDRIGVPRIDLVCVDLYPLEAAIKEGKSAEEVQELTDIGGPTLLRSAAKGRRLVIAEPHVRETVLQWLKNGRPHNHKEFCRALAAKAEATVAHYCLTSAAYLEKKVVTLQRYNT